MAEERGRVDVFDLDELVRRENPQGDGVRARPRAKVQVGRPVLSMRATDRDLIIGEDSSRNVSIYSRNSTFIISIPINYPELTIVTKTCCAIGT